MRRSGSIPQRAQRGCLRTPRGTEGSPCGGSTSSPPAARAHQTLSPPLLSQPAAPGMLVAPRVSSDGESQTRESVRHEARKAHHNYCWRNRGVPQLCSLQWSMRRRRRIEHAYLGQVQRARQHNASWHMHPFTPRRQLWVVTPQRMPPDDDRVRARTLGKDALARGWPCDNNLERTGGQALEAHQISRRSGRRL